MTGEYVKIWKEVVLRRSEGTNPALTWKDCETS